MSFIIYYLIKYRAKKGEGEPVQQQGNQRVELLLTILATAITAVFAFLTINGIARIQDIPEKPEPFLVIVGHQWWWEAHYPKTGVVTANQIHIPTGKKILLRVNSADVIHSWWVQELGRKMDMIPGNDNYIWFYAEKEGEYLGTCSEFCGAQHAGMRIRVTALKPDDFEAWQQQQLLPAVQSSDSLFLKGKNIFETRACAGCHAINGTNFQENVGPNLTHFASRKRFLSDLKEINEENVKAWLRNPQEVKSGARMPNLILSEAEINALAAYIMKLE